MVLGSIFSPSLIKVDLESEDKNEVFEELVEVFVANNPHVSRLDLLDAIRAREDKQSTGIMRGIAIPHGQLDSISGVKGVIGISRNGIEYDSLDGEPVHLVFMLFSSCSSCSFHLGVLHRVAILLKDPAFFPSMLEQRSSEGVYSTICKYEDVLLSAFV
jgi:PTS system fructose-specific IIC component/PTS system nitrogen regulatory IIA component